jgi:LmbE family N-acetylglucosaminyl deacetylase
MEGKMNNYFLLPHYRIARQGLIFLDRERIRITPEQFIAAKKIAQQQHLDTAEVQQAEYLVRNRIAVRRIRGVAKTLDNDSAIVAAHSDDAALSLGGHLILEGQRFEIFTVFNTCKPSQVVLTRYHLNSEEATSFNNAEEEIYARIVGAKQQFLGFKEAADRGYDDVFRGTIKRGDLVDEVERKARKAVAGFKTVYFPLSIGNHVDHIILANIGRSLFNEGRNVLFYEDLPYTKEISEEELKQQLKKKTNGLRVVERRDISSVVDDKVRLAGVYKTQYDGDYLSKLKDYACEIGRGKAIERLWGRK